MNANQPIRGQESLYKLYNNKYFGKSSSRGSMDFKWSSSLHKLNYTYCCYIYAYINRPLFFLFVTNTCPVQPFDIFTRMASAIIVKHVVKLWIAKDLQYTIC